MEGPAGSPYAVCSCPSSFSSSSPLFMLFSPTLLQRNLSSCQLALLHDHTDVNAKTKDGSKNYLLTSATLTQGGKFDLSITLPQTYPFKPPIVTFATKIYHPNISNDSPPNSGTMCLGMLKDSEWKPSTKMAAVLEFARQLLKGMLRMFPLRLLLSLRPDPAPCVSPGTSRFKKRENRVLSLCIQNRTQTTLSKPRLPNSTVTTALVTRRRRKSGSSAMPVARNRISCRFWPQRNLSSSLSWSLRIPTWLEEMSSTMNDSADTFLPTGRTMTTARQEMEVDCAATLSKALNPMKEGSPSYGICANEEMKKTVDSTGLQRNYQSTAETV